VLNLSFRLRIKVSAKNPARTQSRRTLCATLGDSQTLKNRATFRKYSKMKNDYTIPRQTRIGHVHLKVADLKRALEFYRDLLGFELTMLYGSQAAFISAGGYHHHIGLNTWHSKGAPPASNEGVGLYHTAILYPTRKDLAIIYDRLRRAYYPLTGASDHGVSEALYLDDPDGNGVELYWDRPKEIWTTKSDGSLDMFTKPLDLNKLLEELN
jgi:catechol 2,3-dioxygenase